MKTTIEMAREAAGDDWKLLQEFMPEIHRFAELVRADERARVAEQPAQPYKGIANDVYQATNGRMRIDPITGDVCIGTPSPQPAQQEPVALSWVNDDGFLRKKPTEQTAKQEPVAWIWEGRDGYATIELIDLDEQDMQNVSVKSMTPLYTSPPAQRKPMDAGEVSRLWRQHTNEDGPHHNPYDDDGLAFARAIEAAHGIKENT